jgi:hypothetical protein
VIQDVLDAHRTHSAVLFFAVLLLQNKRKEVTKKKKKQGEMAFQLAGWQLLPIPVPGLQGLFCAINS